MINLAVIEQAIKDVMAQQVIDKKWQWIREIKTYGGEFDDETLSFIKTFPAIWVTFEGSGTPKKISHNKTEYPCRFVVLVGASSLRNEESSRHGAASSIGTFGILTNVHKLLIGNDLSSVGLKGLEPLELGKTRTIFNTRTRGQSLSVLAQEFTTQYTITASDRDRERDAEDTLDMHSIKIDYFFQPQDDIADASDVVNLDK